MPRGRTSTATKSGLGGMLKQLSQMQTVATNAIYQTEDLGLSVDEVKQILTEYEKPLAGGIFCINITPDSPARPILATLIRKTCAVYRIIPPKTLELTFYSPRPKSKSVHTIDACPIEDQHLIKGCKIIPMEKREDVFEDIHSIEGCKMVPKHLLHRVIGVAGSHEIFDPSESLIGGLVQKHILVRSGHSIKMNVGPANMLSLSYNDKDTYDKEIYGGKGFKFPHNRWIFVMDMFGETEDDSKKVGLKSLSEVTEDMPEASKMISKLEKNPRQLEAMMSKLTGMMG